MKKFIFFFFALTSLFGFSQAGFNYQAIIKDANGMALSGQGVTMKFNIIYDSTGGSVAYGETHQVTTTVDGLVNLVVGGGTQTANTGAFSQIDWSRALFLKEEVNLGSGFVSLGVGRLYAVPMANYAAKAGSAGTVSSSLVTATHIDATNIYATNGIFSGSASATQINATNASFSGVVTASSFRGDGSGLTNLPSAGSVSSSLSTVTHLDATAVYAADGIFSGTVTASAFSGDGSRLTNVSTSAPLTPYGTPFFDSSFSVFSYAVSQSVVTVGNMRFRYSSNAVGGYLQGQTITGSLDAQRYTRIISPNNTSGAAAGISMHTNSRGFNNSSWDPVLFFWTGSDYSGVGSLSHYKTEEHELVVRSSGAGGSPPESYKVFITIEGGSRVFIRAQYFN